AYGAASSGGVLSTGVPSAGVVIGHVHASSGQTPGRRGRACWMRCGARAIRRWRDAIPDTAARRLANVAGLPAHGSPAHDLAGTRDPPRTRPGPARHPRDAPDRKSVGHESAYT